MGCVVSLSKNGNLLLTSSQNTNQTILSLQLKRFRKQLTGEETPQIVGLKYIENISQNFKTLINNGRIKLLRCEAQNDKTLRLTVQNPGDQVWAEIQAGTLLIPKNTPEQNFQTLVVRQTSYVTIPQGIIDRALNLLCYDCEKDIPEQDDQIGGDSQFGLQFIVSSLKPFLSTEIPVNFDQFQFPLNLLPVVRIKKNSRQISFNGKYSATQLGTLKAFSFKSGMNQKQAWQITINPQKLEMNPNQLLPENKIVFTEKQVKNIMQHLKAADVIQKSNSLYCSLCCQRPKYYVNMICKHLISCEICGKKLKNCTICRAKMQGMRIFV